MYKINKFNNFLMKEEYGLSISRIEQQNILKSLINEINPHFHILFDEYHIQVTINNNHNKTLAGKYQQRLDLHKVSECLEQFIEVEKVVIESGIIPNQFTEFKIEPTYIRLTFSINS